MSSVVPHYSTELPRFVVVLHYLAGHREAALRLLELHGARVLTEPLPLRGKAAEGCVAVEVLVAANYAVIERLQDVLNLDVLCIRTGRFQVGYPAQRSVRINGAVLDGLRRGPLATDSQARPAKAPKKVPWRQ